VCALVSYTNNGFERFTQKLLDHHERAFVHVSNSGAVMLDDAGLELRSLADGTLRWRLELPGTVSPRGVASAANADVWVVTSADGGSTLWRAADAGLGPLASLAPPHELLALDEAGGAWLASSPNGVLTWIPSAGDGGLLASPSFSVSAPDAATNTLATTTFEGFVGNRQLFGSDAGLITTLDWTDDAGEPLRVVERFSLMSQQRASAFYKACPQPLMSCAPEDEQLWVRSISMQTGEVLEEDLLAQSGNVSTLVEAALLDLGGFPPGVLAVVQLHGDAGDSASLRLALNASSDLACPFPAHSDIAGAAIGGGFVWIYVERDGGPYALEAYPLSGISPNAQGWPLADGIAGQRRAR
jgi:hypothetical protein